MIEILEYTEAKSPAGTPLREKPTNITRIDKVLLKRDCVDGSMKIGRPEGIFTFFRLSGPPDFKISEESRSILFEKVNKEQIDRIFFNLEDDDGMVFDFTGETST